MSKHNKVKCTRCNGTGKRPLTGVYAATLDLLRQQGESTGAFLSRIAGCEATAMNNRLSMLEQLGAATSRRDGRERIFKAV